MIIQGDCLDIMFEMESNIVDTVITDPPYGLRFMGERWDYDIPSIEIWEECLRVAKPGATLLCFGGSRTYHRMACAVEDAGWIIKDCILWIYGSGFPKALDISKQMDKRAGAEREVTGKHIATYDGCNRDSNKHKTIHETCVESHKWGFIEKSHGLMDTAPATEEAKQWDGWKSHGLKPAYEPIIVAMKPNDKTYVDNALKWGVSGFNIDECRIEVEEEDRGAGNRTATFGNQITTSGGDGSGGYIPNTKGRFPANIILDEEAGKMLDEQSGVLKSGSMKGIYKNTMMKNCPGVRDGKPIELKQEKNQGGASRFFYCAKSSKSEKNAGVEGGCSHPTVKPLKLMEYLCRLTKTPTGGIVLDPFCGSGSTGVAAINTGREFIGIEMDSEYCKIAESRIKYYENKIDKED